MDTLYNITLPIHVVAGFISLLLFWLPIFVKKGGTLHTRIGWAYVYGMWTVLVTAAIMSVLSLINGNYFISLFLGFLTFITLDPLWYGIAVLKHKRGVPRSFYQKRMILTYLVIIYSIVNIAYAFYGGVTDSEVLLLIFGGLGLTNLKEARMSYDKYVDTIDPIKDHIVGMLTTGIASYTAFFAFGGRTWLSEFLSGPLAFLPWVAPTIIGVAGINWYKQRYTRKVSIA